jgi:hypothetical protein
VTPSFPLLKGMCLPFSGTFTGDAPNDVDTGLPDLRWHICNGGVYNGVTTPDLRDRFVIAAGPTYVAGTTGGAATKNLAHTHTNPTTAATALPSHVHNIDFSSGAPNLAATFMTDIGFPETAADQNHVHDVAGASDPPSSFPTHAHTQAATGSGGSAAQNIMPPYYSLAYVCYVGV